MQHRFIRYLRVINSIVVIILCRAAYLFYECPPEGYVKVAKDDAKGTLYQYQLGSRSPNVATLFDRIFMGDSK